MPVTDKMRQQVTQAAEDYRVATEAREASIERAKKIAKRAHSAGMTQAELATAFGVDRARTIRRWLGIATD